MTCSYNVHQATEANINVISGIDNKKAIKKNMKRNKKHGRSINSRGQYCENEKKLHAINNYLCVIFSFVNSMYDPISRNKHPTDLEATAIHAAQGKMPKTKSVSNNVANNNVARRNAGDEEERLQDSNRKARRVRKVAEQEKEHGSEGDANRTVAKEKAGSLKEKSIVMIVSEKPHSKDILKKANDDKSAIPTNTRPTNISEEERLRMLFNELIDGRFMKVKPQSSEVFMLLNAFHPSKIGDICWSWLNEEKWRLHTFVTYPHDAAKAAILLAIDGFAYIGSGKDRDDLVICFFCCLQKKDWTRDDNIREVHGRSSPNCPMITGRDCTNVPLGAPANSESLIKNLTGRYSSEARGSTKIPTSNKPSTDNRRSNLNVPSQGSDIQPDCAPSIQQPATDGRGFSLQMQTASVQMAYRSIESGVSAAPRNNTTSVLTTTCSQPTQNNAPSHTLTSSSATSSPPVFPTQPAQSGNSTSTQRANSTQSQATSAPAASSNTRPAPASQASSQPSTATSSGNVPAATNTPVPSVSAAPPQGASSNAAAAAPTNTSNTISNNTATAPATQNTNSAPAPNTQNATSSSASGAAQTASSSAKPKKNPTYQELGIITERPKRYEYAQRVKRFETFANWPRDHYLTKDDLSDAGFYFAGYGDCARCFYCGGGLRNWEQNDDAWVEHARWFPKCAFIRQQMGQRFVDTVQELNMEHDQISFNMVAQKMGVPASVFQISSKETPLKRDPAVRTVVNMGFKEEDVLEVGKQLKETSGTLSADVIFEELTKAGKKREQAQAQAAQQQITVPAGTDAKESMSTLKEQNTQLRQQTICKICMDKEVAIVFLPCGHLVSCTDCASAMKDCPVCRNNVKGIVRAFID